MDPYAKRENLAIMLKTRGFKLTRQRRLVFDALAKSGPVSNARLGDELQNALDRATVYRTIELFERIGVVQRIWTGWKSQVELSEAFVPHHHHAVCRICGAHIEINSIGLEKELRQLAGELQFTLEDHSVDLIGVCKNCSK